jgi:hypothetical protein
MDPIRNTIDRNYAGTARLPLRGKLDWSKYMLEDQTFRCNRTEMLGHLVALGYYRQEKLFCHVYGYEGLELLLREYVNPDPPVYEYERLCDLPAWALDQNPKP